MRKYILLFGLKIHTLYINIIIVMERILKYIWSYLLAISLLSENRFIRQSFFKHWRAISLFTGINLKFLTKHVSLAPPECNLLDLYLLLGYDFLSPRLDKTTCIRLLGVHFIQN